MYQLSLKKVEKDINPYFMVNLKNYSSKDAGLLFTDNLQDLREVLILLKREYDKKVKKIINNNKKENDSFKIVNNYIDSFGFEIKIQSKKIYKRKKIKLNDTELDLYIKELIEEELERVNAFYIKTYSMIEDNEEYLNPIIYERISHIEDMKDFELLFYGKNKDLFLEKQYKKEIKRIENKYLKNKEKYREQEIEEIYYENTVTPLEFEIKYFNEKEEEFKVDVKEVSEMLAVF